MPRLSVPADDVAIELKEGETILEGLYRNGYAYRIGCRRGGCAICKVDIVSGEVEYNRPVAESVLSSQEKAAGTCLTCRAVPVGDVVIAMRDEHVRKAASLLAFFGQSVVPKVQDPAE